MAAVASSKSISLKGATAAASAALVFGLAARESAYSARPGTEGPKPTAEQVTFFETKVRPVLVSKCQSCHGPSAQLGNLRLDSWAAMMKGGDSGPAVVPGDADKSVLVTAVRQTSSLKMPQGGKLTADEVQALTDWVKMGAPWPVVQADSEDPKANLWSLKPVRMPAIPQPKNSSWAKNPIDAFVLSKLELKGLQPAPFADKRTLIRRVTYDLTGIPPSSEAVAMFAADKSPDAYEKVVDRLLASPQYGERFARQWLDVARYADTKGYVFNEDRNYPNAYTYRNWVIDSFNRDLPYDQFITQQLAADLLPEVQSGATKLPLAALGFLTVGRRFLEIQPDIIDDRIDVTMRGIEGFTVACARCHDHKFDPIPTQDYYSLYAVFDSSAEKSEPISPDSISVPWREHNAKLEALRTGRDNLLRTEVQRLRDHKDSQSDAIKAVLQALNPEALPEGDSRSVLQKAFEPDALEKLSALDSQISELEKNAPPVPEFAMAMADRPDAHDGVIFKRGNPDNRGAAAPRRFLLALSNPKQERDHWTSGSGRLQLARDIVSKQNPLTARVFVNRLWLSHFGAGIVRTPSDFGHQGDLPSDPKLLDYLAATFMNSGWSIKKMQRLMVTSSTYRQSCEVNAKSFNADPENRLWGRMNRRRLDLEEMRDSILDVAGKLDLKTTGGKSVDLWSKPFTPRRAVYGFIERQNLPGIFRTFDFATPDATSPKRFNTTVPQQALFFMNSSFATEAARDIAERPEVRTATSEAQLVRRMYLLLFDRLPTKDELSLAIGYLGPDPQVTVQAPSAAWSYGYGGYDEQKKAVTFTPFPDFENGRYQASKAFPDPTFGYVTINADGGHPGRDGAHSAIRRWVSTSAGTVRIGGTLVHGQSQGDGVRGRIVSSRLGLLGEWRVHNGKSSTTVASVAVHPGDTIDFVLDPLESDAFDSFAWAPTVQSIDGSQSWNARSDFGPPPAPPMSRLALYAQALMMTNEFSFID